VCLHDIGEPLLHDAIACYIAYAHARRIGTIISTSLSVDRSESFWGDLLGSGLDRLVVAIDGVTPEVYRRYRTNGDLDLVFHNLQNVIRLRRAMGVRISIDWQMIDFPWNKHEQAPAQQMATDLGCDTFRLIHEEQLPRKQYALQRIPRTRNCLMPYLMFIVTARNEVRPCCNLYNGLSGVKKVDNLIGDLRTERFEDVWNGGEVAIIRDPRRIHTRDFCAYCQEM
jgi:MoaA/NifB/PqqE/SkfB family radical SAM enzyme